MHRFHPMTSRFALVCVALVLAALAGCSSHNVKPGEATVQAAQYDLVIDAYKSGQFQLDGAILAATDLNGHFAYLNSVGELPGKVLLRDGAKYTVHSDQLRVLAKLQALYGFKGFVFHDGEMKPLEPDAGK